MSLFNQICENKLKIAENSRIRFCETFSLLFICVLDEDVPAEARGRAERRRRDVPGGDELDPRRDGHGEDPVDARGVADLRE